MFVYYHFNSVIFKLQSLLHAALHLTFNKRGNVRIT